MAEHADGIEGPSQRPPPQPPESPPKPQHADVPPPADAPDEDQLDAVENARRTAGQKWLTDLMLLFVYIGGTTLIVWAFILLRRHLFHH